MGVQFHFCSLTNQDISFQYNGCDAIRFSYTGRFGIKGVDYGEFPISFIEKIRTTLEFRKRVEFQDKHPLLEDESFWSQRLKYIIGLRNIADLNKIISEHNDNPYINNVLFRIINFIINFFSCDSISLFDKKIDYYQLSDPLGYGPRPGSTPCNFVSYLPTPQKGKTSRCAVWDFIQSRNGRLLNIYFRHPEAVEGENIQDSYENFKNKTIEKLYRLEDREFAPSYMCGSVLDSKGCFPVGQDDPAKIFFPPIVTLG